MNTVVIVYDEEEAQSIFNALPQPSSAKVGQIRSYLLLIIDGQVPVELINAALGRECRVTMIEESFDLDYFAWTNAVATAFGI